MLDKKGNILLQRKSVVTTIDNLCAELTCWYLETELSFYKKLYLDPKLADDSLPLTLISNNLQDLVATTDIIPAIITRAQYQWETYNRSRAIGRWIVPFWVMPNNINLLLFQISFIFLSIISLNLRQQGCDANVSHLIRRIQRKSTVLDEL